MPEVDDDGLLGDVQPANELHLLHHCIAWRFFAGGLPGLRGGRHGSPGQGAGECRLGRRGGGEVRRARTLRVVNRSRLHDMLTAGLDRTVTPISAPAGWGKTLLVARG